MSGHPLSGHRFSQTTTTFSDPDLQEQEGLLRNAAPELLAVAKETRDVLRKEGSFFLADHLEQAIEKAEGRPSPAEIRAKVERGES